MRHGIQKTVSTEYDGSTLYHFLREGMGLAKKEISRAKFLEDGICVDGERQKVTAQVRKGQRVTVQTEKPDAVSGHLKASNAPLEILYEDMDVVVVNKPSGIPVHPSGRRAALRRIRSQTAWYIIYGKRGKRVSSASSAAWTRTLPA